MIYFLRNISIRLWLSVAISIPLTFVGFPTIQRLIPNVEAHLICPVFTLFLFIIIGYVMNIVGELSIYKYINGAKNWEREGIFYKSEFYYSKAVELFDSYLFTILKSKRVAIPLTGGIARFALTVDWQGSYFDRATTFFLMKMPQEADVALLWLKKIVKRNLSQQDKGNLSQDEENLLTLLAEMEPLNLQLVPLLSQIFTTTERNDFAAKRVFAAMQKDDDIITVEDKDRQIYTSDRYPEKGFSKLEALEQVDQMPRIHRSFPYRPFSSKRAITPNIKITDRVAQSSQEPSKYLFILERCKSFFLLPIKLFKTIINAITLKPNLRKNIIRASMITVVVGVGIFFLTTLSHLFKTQAPAPPESPQNLEVKVKDVEVQVIPQKRFTIQIAAYLVKPHAQKYLDSLEKKGVTEGRISEVEGGGKTWFLIRIGNYETKEGATSYGNRLKSDGIIDDFFVDNSGG
ncbi:MAG: SPOR domain-containing protein [Desulfamplus sp.]|nr:SPOR domain-containing protein [Desulfamplus sp.]